MTTFWILALLLGATATAFVIVPLSRNRGSGGESASSQRARANVEIYHERVAELAVLRDKEEISQAEFLQLEAEQQKTLLSDIEDAETEQESRTQSGWLPYGFAIAIPLFAILAYGGFGLSWGAIDDVELADSLRHADEGTIGPAIDRLAKRLETQPDNDEGWFFLGRTLINLEQYEQAASAFGRLLGRYPGDPGLNGYYAEALFLADKRQVTSRVDEAVTRTLDLDPNNITMLEIRAMDAFGRGDTAGAIAFFQRALASGAEGERARLIEHAIASMKSSGSPDQSAAQGQVIPAAQGREIDVLVEVDESVTARPDAAVFVFARAANGPPMPLAVARLTRGELPRLIRLDESMAMTPGMGLGDFDEVVVTARISATGGANASPDDYEAKSEPIDLTDKPGVIKLTLSKKIGAN